ncbi:MAG: nucleotidyltransferase family protein [Oscillospiraceae bacterium]|nr:nucleotidyltransferase family protein [Oscillospiraceae bacterium]
MLKAEELFIPETASILDAMKRLDETGQRILFVAPEGRLKAVVTDGDIRKCMLRGGSLEDPISNAANYHPKSLPIAERGRARSEMEHWGIDALPILDRSGVITDIVFADGVNVDNRKKVDIPVVMMAGGLGTRLYPYTKILPKPLIPVGEKPIAEMILSRFREFGCRHMTMIVNYKRGMIKSYFADLEKDYTVDFIDEDTFMGTGGGLCLLKGQMNSPFFFTNCDTLLDIDFGDLYEYHRSHGNLVTMVCAYKHFTVPYGVVELGDDGSIASMREKPELNFLTNTGVYVVEPRVVEEMPDGEFIGFPDVIDRYRAAGEKVGIYPINESCWMDMGQMEELEKMRRRLDQQN